MLLALALDMTVTLGNVMQIVGTAAALFLAYAAIRERLVRIETQIETKLETLWDEYTERRSGMERRRRSE